MYWMGISRTKQRSWRLCFLLGLVLSALAMSLLSHSLDLIMGLWLAVIAEILSILHGTRLIALAMMGCLVLIYVGVQVRVQVATGTFALDVVSLLLFVGGSIVLSAQQAYAHQRTEGVLHELAETHAQLEITHAQLAAYAVQVEELTLAAERQRLARELHDTQSQGLTGLVLQLEAVNAHLAHQRYERAQEIIVQAMARARATLADARQAIDDLRANGTSPSDLPEAVQEEISRFSMSTGIPCTADLSALTLLPAQLCDYALRAITEGLTNIARHAQACQAWVCSSVRDGMVTIEVRDNGIGFDPLATTHLVGHYGLLGLRERAPGRRTLRHAQCERCRNHDTTLSPGQEHRSGDMSERKALIRVAIVDDHLIVREGLRLILETGEGLELVGDAADGAAAIALVESTQPDVVLMDLRMPGMDGLQALDHLHHAWPHIKVIILTTYNEDDLMLKGLQAGACGYLLKDVGRETLLDAIRAAARGETLLQPEMFTRILARTLPASVSTGVQSSTELTEREREILVGVAHGERSKEIATRLRITERTVRGHLTSIYAKLGVDSRAAAVAVALERGLLPR